MRKIFLLVAFLCVAVGPSYAGAWLHGSPANGGGGGGSCPNDAAGYADGCDALIAAGHEGLQKQANFFTSFSVTDGHARVGGRPAWNVAGVEFGVGAWTAVGSMANPTTSPPSGCAYVSADHALECTGSGDLHINGFYFNDVQLYIAGAYCGVIDVSDNYFNVGTNTTANFYAQRLEDQGCANDWQDISNTYDANGQTYNGLAAIVADNRTHAGITQSHKYNAYLNNPSKAIASNVNCSNPNIFYNYDTWAFATGSTSHGEMGLFCVPSATMAQFDVGFNVHVINATDPVGGISPCQGGPTGYDFISSGTAPNSNFTLVNVGHQTYIANQLTSHAICANGVYAEALLVFQEGNYTTVNITENWFYPHGAFYCVAQNASTFTTVNWSGNINLYDGSTVSKIDSDSTPCAGASP